MNEKKVINWHDLIGLALIDLFKGSNFEVKTEQNMSAKRQYVDVLIISKSEGKPLDKLPDGFEFLADYNILTYKSLNESLNQWAIMEVLGHYVSYRKMVSPKPDKLLPESKFQIYAVSTSYPQKLLGSEKNFGKDIKKIKAGVYEISSPLVGSIIILVLSQMEQQEQNAFWQLFSGNAVGFEYGDVNYQWHDPADKSLLEQLYRLYLKEGIGMSYTFEEFHRDYTMPFIESLPIEVRLKGIPPDERLKGLTPDEIKAYLRQLENDAKS
ncbi:MAG: hypothetical protein VSS75_021945 [Candidatus Parabeggiatoa sp.]|nr:hypothetical protein [Candidatus Parabeggiatoa sp.]